MGEEGTRTSDFGEAPEVVLAFATEGDTEIYAEREEEENVCDNGDEEVGEEEDEAARGEHDEMEGGEYSFIFKNGMNPLDFIENDAFGVQSYQKFERLEYEALAEKKRKALPNQQHEGSKKKARLDDGSIAYFEELMENVRYGGRRKSRKLKMRGRRKGSKNKLSPDVMRKLGDANIHYAHGRYKEAVCDLNRAVRLAPNLPDPYHTLGLVYTAIGDKKKALNFYMLAAFLSPKNAHLWKSLVSQSIEQGNTGQIVGCLSKAISADPEDINLRFHLASLYVDLGDNQKAAESYVQISKCCPEREVETLKTGAKLYLKCGWVEDAVRILEEYFKQHSAKADLSVLDLLAATCMENKFHSKALQHIEFARVYCSEKELPLSLTVKEGICHIHLGNIEKAKILFNVLQEEIASDHVDSVMEVAVSFMSIEHYESALKYLLMLKGTDRANNGLFNLKIAQCYLSLKERIQAVSFFYKALEKLEDNVDARLTLASLLLEESKTDEAISLLSPPKDLDFIFDPNSDVSESWWLHGKVKLKLSHIYKANGRFEEFVDAIFPLVRESLFIKTVQQKVKARKKLSTSVLVDRTKVLDNDQTDNIFHGFGPVGPKKELLKATRAKKLLQKKETLRKERKVAALAAGVDWQTDDSDDESPKQVLKRVPPLPNLLKDEEHHRLIIDLCKALSSLRRFWEALEIINLTLKLARNLLSTENNFELRSLGAQIAYNITDPKHGFDCVKYIVLQHPYSLAAWNCYYKVISRLENRYSRHSKFLHGMRVKFEDCVPPMIVNGHQFTMISQHQAAAREYLEAYKLMPESPLINLCAGSALINLALGFRLQNKHQCLTQGLAFFYNNLRLCENSQEALYNIARAYHHVGLVSLAALSYEKVLATHEKDYPIPKLPNENPTLVENQKPGHCDLRREAAYNLHLIYKKSGAYDLAKQVLKDHCTL